MEHKNITVGAVMTAPRYECVQARNCIELALQKIGIPLAISGGVYYGQCMQNMLDALCQQDVDYALTVDFDSIFSSRHVQRLLDIMASHESIHALAALQPMRGTGRALGSKSVHTEVEYAGHPIQVNTAHFGLTVLRLDRLKLVPKPWFVGTPNADGEWGEGRLDEDVHFWKVWNEAGNSVYLDFGTRLGHLEEMVSTYDETGKLVHWYLKDWEERRASTVD